MRSPILKILVERSFTGNLERVKFFKKRVTVDL